MIYFLLPTYSWREVGDQNISGNLVFECECIFQPKSESEIIRF